jgi:AcrR family transcriptional regulator
MSESNPPKARGRPRTLNRERTIAVAMESYWREGLHGLSINEICRRAEIAKPGLYREFGGEDGLMDAVLSHYLSRFLVPLFDMLSADRPFGEVLSDLLEWMTHPQERPSGCLLVRMRSATDRLGPQTMARVEAVQNEMLDAYRGWFERARRRGEAAQTVDADLAAHYIDTQLTTVLFQMAAGGTPDLVLPQAELAFAALRR